MRIHCVTCALFCCRGYTSHQLCCSHASRRQFTSCHAVKTWWKSFEIFVSWPSTMVALRDFHQINAFYWMPYLRNYDFCFWFIKTCTRYHKILRTQLLTIVFLWWSRGDANIRQKLYVFSKICTRYSRSPDVRPSAELDRGNWTAYALSRCIWAAALSNEPRKDRHV